MSWVVIVKTAKEQRLWNGLPDDYPVACVEDFESEAAALAAYPGRTVMHSDDYRKFAEEMHAKYPSPEAPPKKWWQFWRKS
jgi:hypothetical protein